MVDLTAIVLTKNEEKNIVDCIQSLKGFAKRVVVVDSGSTDATVELAKELGCVGFATGHYARGVQLANGRYAIAMGKDRKKDQSYMLWGLSQEETPTLGSFYFAF